MVYAQNLSAPNPIKYGQLLIVPVPALKDGQKLTMGHAFKYVQELMSDGQYNPKLVSVILVLH